jgi:hypothetical protein
MNIDFDNAYVQMFIATVAFAVISCLTVWVFASSDEIEQRQKIRNELLRKDCGAKGRGNGDKE